MERPFGFQQDGGTLPFGKQQEQVRPAPLRTAAPVDRIDRGSPDGGRVTPAHPEGYRDSGGFSYASTTTYLRIRCRGEQSLVPTSPWLPERPWRGRI